MSDRTSQLSGKVGRIVGTSAAYTARRCFAWMASGLVIVTITAGALAYWGVFEVAADRPHWPMTERFLDVVRSRSVSVSARTLEPPDLTSETRVLAGAGNYDAMCAQCHLRPGVSGTEISAVLYPVPPNLATRAPGPDREAFWVIKHGIKMTGMGAWGKKIPDEDIWNLVAFVKTLPTLSPAKYDSMVSRSGGHTHAGAERGIAPRDDPTTSPGYTHDRDVDRGVGSDRGHGRDKARGHAHGRG